jgi:hypothetical protein
VDGCMDGCMDVKAVLRAEAIKNNSTIKEVLQSLKLSSLFMNR